MKNGMQPSGIIGKWRWLLGLSLALNLLVIGAVAGAAWRHAGPGSETRHRGGGFSTPYLRALPDAARTELRSVMRASRDQRRNHRKERHAQYAEIAKILAAEPFDPVALQGLLAAQKGVGLARQEKLQDAWLAVVEGMDVDTRQAYAARVIEVLERPRRHKRRKP